MEKFKTKPWIIVFIFVVSFLCLGNKKITYASEVTDEITISVEKFTIGQGYLIEPCIVPIYSGDNCAMVLDRLLKEKGYEYTSTGHLDSSFYLAGIYNADNGNTNIPGVIQKMSATTIGGEIVFPPNNNTINPVAPQLSERSYGEMSGWMYTLNGEFPDAMSSVTPNNGDVMRVQYTAYGYGADLGSKFEGPIPRLEIADKDALTKKVAQINKEKNIYLQQEEFQTKYDNALAVLTKHDAKQWQVEGALEELNSGQTETIMPTSITLDENVNLEIHNTYQLSPIIEPSNATLKSIIFTVLDSSIVSVDEKGIITPKSVGKTDVIATTGNGLTATCHITVYKNPVTLTGISISNQKINVGTGSSLSIVTVPEDADSPYILSFVSSDSSVVTVDEKGALEGKKDGTATITVTATLTENPNTTFTDTCTVEVVSKAEGMTIPLATVMDNVKNYILATDTEPDQGSQWYVIGLSRSGLTVPETYKNAFYNSIAALLKEKNGVLTKTKYSDYSKLILSMTAIGKDARNIEGYNLLSNLADFDKVKYQGFNGPIWALIALNANPAYEIPTVSGVSNQTTEAGLIDYLLKGEVSGGGWTLFGNTADVDMTAMTIQALAPYYKKSGYENVTAAIDRALNWLSGVQMADGGFYTLSDSGIVANSESTSQVITALSAIGIDCMTDSRFVKAGKWPVNALLSYYKDGGFMHVKEGGTNNGGAAAGKIDSMATEQAFYALAAYKRMLEGKTSLYDMSDVSITPANPDKTQPENPTTQPTDTKPSDTNPSDTRPAGSVKVTGIKLNQTSLSLNKGASYQLKATILPANASDQSVIWKSSDPSIASVNSSGKVTAKKTGQTKITATSRSGSQQASCTVKVIEKLGLKVSKATTTALTLKWNKITGAKGYKIFRYDTSRKKYVLVAAVSAGKNSYTFKRLKGTKLTPGTVYKLRVAAYQTVKGATVYKKTETLQTATKPAKAVVKVTGKSAAKVRITWKKVKGSSGYEIYMSTKKKSGYKKIKTITSSKKVSYTKTKLKKRTTYYFKVRAYKKVGNQKIYGACSTVKSIKTK